MVSANAWPHRRAHAEPRGHQSRRAVLRGVGAVLLGGGALTLAGCRTAVAPPPARSDHGALAERYTRLALQLAKHQPSLIDAWLGPPAWTAGPRLPAPVLRVEAAQLLRDVETLVATDVGHTVVAATTGPGPTAAGAPTDRIRTRYLAGQIRALDDAAGRLLGEGRPFADEARRTFGHTAPPRDAALLDAHRQRLSEALPGRGTLAERHAAFRRSLAVPAGRVETVFAAAVAWCRSAAREVLPLPEGEALTAHAENASGWAAFSRPTGPRTSDVWVATGGGADAAHLLQLAAHEGTPGHHAQHVLASAQLVEALGWTERLLHPAFGPHRLWVEGAAEAGAELLLPHDVRVRVCREILLPAAGLPPARAESLVRVERLAAELDLEVAYVAADYLDTSLSADVATNRLRDDALVLDPAGLLSFVEKQRAKVLAYPVGRRLVRDALEATSAAERWAHFASIATTLTLGE